MASSSSSSSSSSSGANDVPAVVSPTLSMAETDSPESPFPLTQPSPSRKHERPDEISSLRPAKKPRHFILDTLRDVKHCTKEFCSNTMSKECYGVICFGCAGFVCKDDLVFCRLCSDVLKICQECQPTRLDQLPTADVALCSGQPVHPWCLSRPSHARDEIHGHRALEEMLAASDASVRAAAGLHPRCDQANKRAAATCYVCNSDQGYFPLVCVCASNVCSVTFENQPDRKTSCCATCLSASRIYGLPDVSVLSWATERNNDEKVALPRVLCNSCAPFFDTKACLGFHDGGLVCRLPPWRGTPFAPNNDARHIALFGISNVFRDYRTYCADELDALFRT